MSKTNDEFNALTGTPKRFGKADPNSMSNRILGLIPTDGAVKTSEVRKSKTIKDMTDKQVKTILSNLVNKKDKSGNAKVDIKHDDDHEPWFRKNPE